MTDYALDYSAGAPAATAVRAAGYVGVIRYCGFPANRKCVTHGEYADMLAHGVGVGLVFEQFANDALQGAAGGRRNAALARAHAADIGFPPGRPIYMACDTDIVTPAQFATVLDYLRGAGEILGGPQMVGVYGEYDVIDRAATAGVAAWFWQTRAWSGGRRHPRAHLLQELGTFVVDGIGCDRNTILAPDWGQAGTTVEDAMPSAADMWAVQLPWPNNLSDVPPLSHAKASYTAEEWLTGASINAARAVREAGDAQAAVAGLAKVVAQIGAQVGTLTDDEAKILAATGTATTKVLGAVQALLAAEGATEARLVAAIEAVPAAPGGGVDGAAVVAALRDTLIAGTA